MSERSNIPDRPTADIEAMQELQKVRRQYEKAHMALEKAIKDLIAIEARVAVLKYRKEKIDV